MSLTQKLANRIVRARLSILILATIVTGFAGVLSTEVEFESDIEIWFLENDPTLVSYNEFLERFDGDELIVLGVFSDEIFTPELLKAIDTDTLEGAKAPGIIRSRSITNVKVPVVREEDMRVDLLFEELPSTEEEARAAKEVALGNPLIRGRLLAEDGKAAAIVYEFGGEENTFERKVAAVDGLEKAIEGVFPDNARVVLAGSPVFDRAFFVYSQNDFAVMGLVAVFVVLLMTFFIFRRIAATLLPVGIVVMTVLWLFGLMVLLGIKVNMVSTGLVTLAIAVGVADSVHLLSEFYTNLKAGATRQEAVKTATSHILVPCFFTSMTTGLGFLALLAGDLAPIGEFGWLSAIAVLFAFGLSMTVLPAALCYLPNPSREVLQAESKKGVERVLRLFSRPSRQRAMGILLAALALFCVALYGFSLIKAESNPVNYFKPGDPVRSAMTLIDERLGGSASMEFLIETEEDGLKDPEILNALSRLREKVLQVEGFTQIFSPLESLEEAHRTFVGGEGIPQQREMNAQLFLILEGEPEEFETVVQGNYDVGRMSARTRFDVPISVRERKEQVERAVAEESCSDLSIQITGFVKLMTDMEIYLFEGQIRSFVLALLVISIVLFFLLRSVPLGFLAFIPNLTPIAFGLAFMAFADINLDPGTVMIGPIALGLVVDDTVHFLYRYQFLRKAGESIEDACEKTLYSAGRAIVTTSFILAAGFSVLALGSFIPNIYFGLVTSVVVLVAMVADVVVLPAVLILFRPKA